MHSKEPRKVIGQDILYVCQTCSHREKEFAMKDRITKICTKCGNWSIKSTLCDTLDYVNAPTSNFFDSEYGLDD